MAASKRQNLGELECYVIPIVAKVLTFKELPKPDLLLSCKMSSIGKPP
jgi:hypothetical protein